MLTRIYLSLFLLCGAGFGESLLAQDLITFEDFGIPVGEFRNRTADGSGAFTSGDLSLPNTFTETPTISFWSGWALSATTDATTPGLGNQYSSVTGGGADGSNTYAVTFGNGRIETSGRQVNSLAVTNSTYAAESMRRGDQFTKRFGGVTGDDPDFFNVTFRGWRDGARTDDSLTVFLADFQFSDNAQDFILDAWQTVDFSAFGQVDSLTYSFASSDVGAFGINTPTYFCMDNVILEGSVGVRERRAPTLLVYPNPVVNTFSIQDADALIGETYYLFDPLGRAVATGIYRGRVDLDPLARGVYTLRFDGAGGSGRIVVGAR